MAEINCSLDFYEKTDFVNWSLNNTSNCLLNTAEKVGNNIWPGNWTIGFLILIGLVLMIIYLISGRKK